MVRSVGAWNLQLMQLLSDLEPSLGLQDRLACERPGAGIPSTPSMRSVRSALCRTSRDSSQPLYSTAWEGRLICSRSCYPSSRFSRIDLLDLKLPRSSTNGNC